MTRRRWVLIAAAVVAIAGVGALIVLNTGGGGPANAGWVDVTPRQLSAMLTEQDLPLVNVHVPYEGEIPGTDAFIPYNEIGSRLDELSADRGTKLVVYCRSGRMSLEAARTLVAAGYTNVYNLVGGFEGWAADGYKLIQRQGVSGNEGA